MNITSTAIPDVKIIEPKIFSDDRGFFMEVYNQKDLLDAGINQTFVQENQSGSKQGVLRGIHYQIKHAQGKLVRVVLGEVFDIAVDLRTKSPTFGKYVAVSLSKENRRQLWVPPGFGHAFYVVSEWAEFTYLVTDIYAPEYERTVLWNDPDINIVWPFDDHANVQVSKKDSAGVRLAEAELYD